MLTTADAKAARPQTRAYKLHDEGGLHLFVAPTGRKSWRLAFRWRGKEQLITFGRFPDLSLVQARARRDGARDALSRNTDPRNMFAKARKANTIETLARSWHAHNLAGWSTAHAADAIGSIERDILPAIGARVVGELEPSELLELLRAIEGRGAIETARRVRQRLDEIFAFGIAEGLCSSNPAVDLGAALKDAPPARPQPALTAIADCRALLATCDQVVVSNKMTTLASRFLALTAVRLEAVRGMRWGEIDWDARTWTVPAVRMKLKLAKKGEARFDHVVPLSAAAIAVLEEAKLHSHDANLKAGDLVFPGRSAGKPIGEGAIGALYDRAGFAGRHVPHGWRASFSTILNEDLGEEWALTIDRALAHAGKDKVEAAYNRSQLLERRRAVFDRWGELLAGG